MTRRDKDEEGTDEEEQLAKMAAVCNMMQRKLKLYLKLFKVKKFFSNRFRDRFVVFQYLILH